MPIYIPVANRMTDRATMLAFMQQYDFATLISNSSAGTPLSFTLRAPTRTISCCKTAPR